MKSLPYYKRYARDFFEGTVGMAFEVKAAYALILDLIYMHGGRLPDDARFIAGHLALSVRKWNRIRSELLSMDKIQIIDGFISNYRAVSELEKTRKLQEKNAENGCTSRKNKDLTEARDKLTRDNTEPDIYIYSSLRSEYSAAAPEKPEKKKPEKPERPGKPKPKTPAQVLRAVLDDEHAKAIIEHRKAMRAPLTTHASKLLADQLSECVDQGFFENANQAADRIIERGWRTIKPGWGQNSPPASRPYTAPKMQQETAFQARNREIDAALKPYDPTQSQPKPQREEGDYVWETFTAETIN